MPIEGLPELPLDFDKGPRRRGKSSRDGERGSERPGRGDRDRKDRERERTPAKSAAAPAAERPERAPPPAERPERVPDRKTSTRSGSDRSDRKRGRDHDIGEMSHDDDVVGFGAHIPDFLAGAITLPEPAVKRTRVKK
jgi:hypothetical protein